MASIILLDSGGELMLHVSKRSPEDAARVIADCFEGFSTDNETTEVVPSGGGEIESLCVEMTIRNETSTLATVLELTAENLAWAIKEMDLEQDPHLAATGLLV